MNKIILIIILLGKNLFILIILHRVRITMHKCIFSKGYIKNWSRETIVTDSVL